MRICVIDLGSNSVRFDIYQLFQDKNYKKIYSEKLMIQLGKDAFSLGHFSKKTLSNTLGIFQYFSQLLQTMQVDQTHAYATAAVRHAKNKKELIQKIMSHANIALHVISGQQEAKYIYEGLVAGHNTHQSKKFLCVDIGGGSTEISVRFGKKIYHDSIALGSSLIKEAFLKGKKNSPPEIEQLRSHIQKTLHKHFSSWPNENLDHTFGSSGTVKGIVKVLKDNQFKHQSCTLLQLQKLVQKTCLLDYNQLKDVPHLEEKRIEMFTGGNILLEEILLFFKCTKFEYSDAALKEGLFQSLLKKKPSQQKKVNPLLLKAKQHRFINSYPIIKKHIEHLKKQSLILKKIFTADISSFEDARLMLFLHQCSMQYCAQPDYATFAYTLEKYPYFYSDKNYKSIQKLFKLYLGYENIKLRYPAKKKITAAVGVFIWLQKQGLTSPPCYTIKKSTLNIDCSSQQFNFLQIKQFEQVKKTFEEQFDLKIKLLYECYAHESKQ